MTQEKINRLEQIKNGEIPKGYKHSIVGIIPKDWEVLRLKDKFDRLSRKNAEGNTNVLTISAQYGLINQEEFFKKAVASDDKSNYYLLQRGEFAYNKSYSNGYPFGAIKRLSRYDKGVVSPLYICFSANADNACPEYYEQYFEAGRLNHEIQAFAQEGARNHGLLNISVSDFFNSFILVPPVAEQEKIAKILLTQDKVIECYEKKIEQLKRMKKYYLQNMFPKRGETVPKIRFKGFTDAWEQRKLGDCFVFLQNNTLSRAELSTETGIALNIHYGDVLIKFGEFLDVSYEQMSYITDKSIVDKFKGSLLNDGDVIMADTAEDEAVGKCSEIAGLQGKVAISGLHTIPLRPVRRFASGFLGYYMNSNTYHNQLLPLMQGIKVTSVSKNAIRNTEISYPVDNAEQAAIGEYFIRLDNLITLHQRLCDEEKKKKKALQQLLLTGIVRVKV